MGLPPPVAMASSMTDCTSFSTVPTVLFSCLKPLPVCLHHHPHKLWEGKPSASSQAPSPPLTNLPIVHYTNTFICDILKARNSPPKKGGFPWRTANTKILSSDSFSTDLLRPAPSTVQPHKIRQSQSRISGSTPWTPSSWIVSRMMSPSSSPATT